MAVSGVPAANAVPSRLDYLLKRARIIKQSTDIEPPLQISHLVPDDQALFSDIEGESSLAVESAMKQTFYSILKSFRIDEPGFVNMWNLLDIVQYCGDRGKQDTRFRVDESLTKPDLCSPQLVLLLVEELLDSQPIAECRTGFKFLESRRDAIIAISSTSKDLVILRLCNELLRRFSRAEDPVFCGRVYVFMFQSFPLGARSSVNLRGDFHVENVTTFETFLREEACTDSSMLIDSEVKDAEPKEEPSTIEVKASETGKGQTEKPGSLDIDALYPVFWSLQHSFSNPPRLFEDDNLEHFKTSLEATLAKFKAVPKVIQAADLERKRGPQTNGNEDHETFADTYNPKYLTSRDLFKLELSDVAFQRHILVQALILVDFLLTLSDKSKSKPLYQNAQKALQYSFTLREEDTEWALGIKNAIANYLQEGPDGKFYYRMVDTVLSRDKNWVRWKMESCLPFTRDRLPTQDFLQAKSGAQQDVVRKKAPRPMGIPRTLGFLNNTEIEKGLAQLKQRDRFNVPNAESYATQVRTVDLDLDMADTEEEKRQLGDKKSSYVWRGLRLGARTQLSSFDRIEHGKGLEALQPVASSVEATGNDTVPITSDDRDSAPQEENQYVEEQRAEDNSQVTTDAAATSS